MKANLNPHKTPLRITPINQLFGGFIRICDLGFACVGLWGRTAGLCIRSGATPYKKKSREFGGIFTPVLGLIQGVILCK